VADGGAPLPGAARRFFRGDASAVRRDDPGVIGVT